MWPTQHFPARLWPKRHWAIPNNFVQYLLSRIRTRRLLAERWEVSLIDSAGTEYNLGFVDITAGSASEILIPPEVPDGTYTVRIWTWGLAWKQLEQKPIGTITIDRTSSTPILDGVPLLTNFRYDIHQGWLRLLWDGDVPLANSGLVSAGVWLTAGVPDFSSDPTVTVPLFSYNSTHQYIVRLASNPADTLARRYWTEMFWLDEHWLRMHWLGVSGYAYAGLAAYNADGERGPGQYIAIPDRGTMPPSVVIEEG